MGKNKGGAQYTPFQDELICTLCNKLGNAYQCSFCENYRTCGECGVCNNANCKAETKVKKPPVSKEKAAAPTPKAPVNVPGLSTKQEPKAKGPKVNSEDDAYLEKKIEQAQKEQNKKAEAKKQKEKIKLVAEAPQPTKKKASKAEVETVGPNSPRPGEEKKATTVKAMLAEVDVGAVADTEGNLSALKELLETTCQRADVGVARIGLAATTTALNEPLSEAPAALRKALEATVKAADFNSAKAIFSTLAKEIADDFKKPEAQKGMGHARLLLAQIVARVHPAVVVDAAVVAEKTHGGYKSQHTAIPVMWLLAQARDTDMAVTIDAWAQYYVGALLAKETGDVMVRQYAAKYTELLAGSKLQKRESKEGVRMDLISLYQKAYSTADDTYADVLMTHLNFVKGVFLQYALREQVVDVFHKIVVFYETRPRQELQPYADAVTELAGQLLTRDGWLLAVWREEAQSKVAGPTAVAKALGYLKGSQHLLEALRARGYVQTLHRSELQRTVVSLAATGEQLVAKIGKPSEKKGDLASKAANATQFFHDFNRSLAPSKWPARLRWLFVLALICALVLKSNSHCTAYPCGPARACGPYHPCRALRQPAVSPYLDLAAAQAETLRVAALEKAEPIMPYVNQAQNLLQEHVVVPASPHVARAYDTTKAFVEAEVVPAASKMWVQAKPHVDTAVAWADVNVRPHAEVAYEHASTYAQQGWVWADANVLQPGSVYVAQGAEWAQANVVPHVHSAVAVAAAKAGEASEHVSKHVYPHVAQTANQLWAQGKEAATKAGDWVRAEAAQVGPRAQQLYDQASVAAAKYYGEARVHVQRVANEAQPWVEKNVVPHVQTAWNAASENAQAALQWAQAKIAELQK